MEPQTLACRIGAGLSTSESAWDAATEAARDARSGVLGRAEVDLAFIFLSPAHLVEAEAVAEAVREELAPGTCSAASPREWSRVSASSRRALRWPSGPVRCRAWRSSASTLRPCRRRRGSRWRAPDLEDPGLVALVVDPFTFPVGPFLARLNETHERIPLVGGLAAGGGQSGRQALILDDAVYAEGAVGAVVSGLPVLTVVSQGCRPIGRESVITRCEGNTSTRSPESRRSSACVGRSPPSPPKSKRSSRADSSPGS